MKQFFASILVLSMFSLVTVGCAEKSTTTRELEVSGPGGTTTVTVEKEVKTTGENPPSVQP